MASILDIVKPYRFELPQLRGIHDDTATVVARVRTPAAVKVALAASLSALETAEHLAEALAFQRSRKVNLVHAHKLHEACNLRVLAIHRALLVAEDLHRGTPTGDAASDTRTRAFPKGTKPFVAVSFKAQPAHLHTLVRTLQQPDSRTVLTAIGLADALAQLDQLQAEFASLMAPPLARVATEQVEAATTAAIEAMLRVVMSALLADPEPRADGAPSQAEDVAFRDAVSGVYLEARSRIASENRRHGKKSGTKDAEDAEDAKGAKDSKTAKDGKSAEDGKGAEVVKDAKGTEDATATDEAEATDETKADNETKEAPAIAPAPRSAPEPAPAPAEDESDAAAK
jgi:hypothetical protein